MSSSDSPRKFNKVYKKLLSDNLTLADIKKIFTKKDSVFTSEPEDGIRTLFGLMEKYSSDPKIVSECTSMLYKLSIEPQIRQIMCDLMELQKVNGTKYLLNAFTNSESTRVGVRLIIKLLENNAGNKIADMFLNSWITEKIFIVMRQNNTSREVQTSCFKLLQILSKSPLFPKKVTPDNINLMLFMINIFNKNTDILFHSIDIISALAHTELKQEMAGKMCSTVVSAVEASKTTERSREFTELALKFIIETPNTTKEAFVVERKAFQKLLNILANIQACSLECCVLVFDAMKGCGEANYLNHSDILGSYAEAIVGIIVRFMKVFPKDCHVQEKGFDALSFYFTNFETCKSALQPPNDDFKFVTRVLIESGSDSFNIQRYGCNVLVHLSHIGDTTAKLISEELSELNPESLITRLGNVPLEEDIGFHTNAYAIFGNFFKFRQDDIKKTKVCVTQIARDNVERCMNSKMLLNANLLHSAIQLFTELFSISTQRDLINRTVDIVLNAMKLFENDSRVQSAGCVYFNIYITTFNSIPMTSVGVDVFAMEISKAVINYPKDSTICMNACRIIYALWKTTPLSNTSMISCERAMCLILGNFYKDPSTLEMTSLFLGVVVAPENAEKSSIGLLTNKIVDIFNGLSLTTIQVSTINNLIMILQNIVMLEQFKKAPERFARISDTLFNIIVVFRDNEPTLLSIYYILLNIGNASSAGANSLKGIENGEDRIKTVLSSLSAPGFSQDTIHYSFNLLIKSLANCLISRVVTKQIAVAVLSNIKHLDTRMCTKAELYKIISDIFARFHNVPEITAFGANSDFLATILEHTKSDSSVEIMITVSRIFSIQFLINEYMPKGINYTGTVVQFMKEYPSDEHIQMNCLNALANAAQYYKTVEVVRNAFDTNKVSNVVSEQMEINRGNSTIQQLCRKILDFAPVGTKGLALRGSSSTSSLLDSVKREPGHGSSLELLLRTVPKTFYEKIEESLNPNFFKNVRQMMKYSLETTDYLKEHGLLSNLTVSDAIAVTVYTYDNGPKYREMNVYRIINKVLSERNTNLIFQVRGYIIRLLAALRKLPLFPTDVKLYRGIRGKLSKGSQTVGSVLTWPAFTSTTTDRNSVENFLNSGSDEDINTNDPEEKAYIFEITGKFRGYNIREFSFHPGEEEVLLEPETVFKVNAVTEYANIPGVTCISVEVLESEPILKEITDNFTEMVQKMESSQADPLQLSTSNSQLTHSLDGSSDGTAFEQQTFKLDKFYCSTAAEVPFPQLPQGYYQTLKDSLGPIFGNKVFYMLGLVKSNVVDNVHTEIMNSYNLAVEDVAAISLCTFDDLTPLTPMKLLNSELAAFSSGQIQGPQVKTLGYLLHLMSGLYNLQFYNDTNKVYVPFAQSDMPATNGNTIFTLPTFTTAYPNESSARKACPVAENVVLLEISNYMYCYNIAPFSLNNSSRSILLIPGIQLCVTYVYPTEGNITKISACAMTQDNSSEANQVSSWIKCAIQAVEQFKENSPLPEDWISTAKVANFSNTFYYNVGSRESQVEKPRLVDSNFFAATFDHGFRLATVETYYKLWKMEFDCVTRKVFYTNTLTNETLAQIPEYN